GPGLDLAFDGVHPVVEPAVPLVVARMLRQPQQPAHPRVGQRRQALPVEQYRGPVVGLERTAEFRLEGAVDPTTREVRRAVPRREAALGPPLGDQEASSLGSGHPFARDAPALRRRERDAIEGFQAHQRAANPAAVVGTPSQAPTIERCPCSPTDQPTIRPWSASIAYRNALSSDRSSSRRPGCPSVVSPATASSSMSLPSAAIA